MCELAGVAIPRLLKVPEIMATVGPTMEKRQDLSQAIQLGAKWFRLPCGYRQRPHVENALAVRSASAEVGTPIELLLDLPSSRPRIGTMQELRLAVGDRVLFWDPEARQGDSVQRAAFGMHPPGTGCIDA